MSDSVLDFLASKGVIVPNHFAHYGVPGMRWGRRKSSSAPTAVIQNPRTGGSAEIQLTRRQTKQIARGSTAPKHDNSIAAKPKNRRISDAELRAKVNRLQLEKQLKDLTAPAPRTENFAKQVMRDAGRQAVRTLATRAVGVGVELALGKAASKATGAGNKAFLDAMVAAGQKGGKGKKAEAPTGGSQKAPSSNSSQSTSKPTRPKTNPKDWYKPPQSSSAGSSDNSWTSRGNTTEERVYTLFEVRTPPGQQNRPLTMKELER